MSGCDALSLALAQLRRAHPQWGWCLPGAGGIAGESPSGSICQVSQGRGGGWRAVVTVWRDGDWADGDVVDHDAVRAFVGAWRAVEVVR